MKQFIYLIFMIVAFTGCKRKWECDCTYTYYFGGSEFSSTTSEESEKISKKNAEEWCTTDEITTGEYSRSCELK